MSLTRTRNTDISKVLDQLKHREIVMGFFDTAHYPDGTPVAYVAAIQEFGYAKGNIPPRPFMRPTAKEKQGEWAKQVASGVKAAMRGAISLDAALEQVGRLGASQIQDAIESVSSPALESSTIYNRRHRKKQNKNQSVKPLVDTGKMLESVNYAVQTV